MPAHLDPLPLELRTIEHATEHAATLAGATVETLIQRLEKVRAQLALNAAPDQLVPLAAYLKTSNAKLGAAHKDWGTAVTRFGKDVERKFATPLDPLFPPPPVEVLSVSSYLAGAAIPRLEGPPTTFGSPAALAALNETIALHLARIGAFETLDIFLAESATPTLEQDLSDQLRTLHGILHELGSGGCTRALAWVVDAGLADGDLEFELRKEEYIQLLLRESDVSGASEPLLPPGTVTASVRAALEYGGAHFRQFVTPARQEVIGRLLTAPLWMPFSRLVVSPYAELFVDYAVGPDGSTRLAETRLQATFAAAYLQTMGLPRLSPLTVVTDIGGGGALAVIQKVRAVMKERKTEWSAVEELPVEIPIPTQHRHHSIFTCPVSKEQGTTTNPPMLLPCGHVIANDSLKRLGRGSPNLKCPYCPTISQINAAIRVHF